jgi:hypothetical protein
VTNIRSYHYSVMHLDGGWIGRQSALTRGCIRMMSIMFKITQNTIHYFSLAEILLMAAMNEIEATQKALGRASNPEGIS